MYDIDKFKWETGKERLTYGINIFETIKMVDASPEQLNSFYKHANEMLYNNDNGHFGREIELKTTKKQRIKCNTELFLRFMEKNNNIPRYTLMDTILETVHSNELSHHHISDLKIQGLSYDFANIPLDIVIDGCKDNLGVLKNKNLTTMFIISYGIWLPKEDVEMLNQHYPGISTLNSKIIKYLSWTERTKIKITPKGLTLSQIKAISAVKDVKFNKMTDEQLHLLRNRILIDIENLLKKQIAFWQRKINEIKIVATHNQITLKEND